MKKSTKGAMAAAAAGVLLLGGAGSLAFWSATDTVAGTSVASGELKLSEPTCTGWQFDGEESTADKPYVAGTDKIVPGDVLTQTCDYTITARGEHLRAELTTVTSSNDGGLASFLTQSSTFEYKTPAAGSDASAGDAVETITETENGSVVTAELKIVFDADSGNESQSTLAEELSAAMGDYEITLQQQHVPVS